MATAKVVITGDSTGAQNAINSLKKKMKDFGEQMQAWGKTLSTYITLPLVGAGAAAIKFASDAEEVQSKFNVVFGDMADTANQWAENFAASVGRAKTDVKSWMASLQDTFVPLGFARDQAAEMSKTLTQLAVDVASFNNAADADVIRDFQSAIVGNHETVRKYGIILTEETLKQEAYASGIAKAGEELTEQQKILTRFRLILKGTTDAHGDAIRTADSFANQMKALKSILKDAGETIGKILLPYARQLVGMLKNIIAWFQTLSPAAQRTIVVLGGIAAAIGPLLMLFGTMTILISNAIVPLKKLGDMFKWLGGRVKIFATTIYTSLGPVGITIAGLIAIGAALYYAWKKNFLGLGDLMKNIAELIGLQFQRMANSAKIAWAAIKNYIYSKIEDILEMIRPFTKLLPAFMRDAYNEALNVVRSKQEDIAEQTRFFRDEHERIMNEISSQSVKVGESFENVKQKAKELVSNFVDSINPVNNLTEALAYQNDALKDVTASALNTAAGLYGLGEEAQKTADKVEEAMKRIERIVSRVKHEFSSGIRSYYKAISQGLISYSEAKRSVSKGIEKKYGKEGLKALYEDMKKTYYAASKETLDRMFKVTYGVEPPKLGEGGIIKGPTILTDFAGRIKAIAGEAGPEAIVPLKGGNRLFGNITINITGNYIANDYDANRLGDIIVRALKRHGVKP